jgi:YD repeat-containing protein
MLTSPHPNCLRWLFSLLLVVVLTAPALAQQPITFQYFYDDLEQLVKVIDSAGNVIEYVYDPVGNILEIKRSSVSALAIFSFTPQHGPVTTKVTIQGQGFSANPIDNVVLPGHWLQSYRINFFIPPGARPTSDYSQLRIHQSFWNLSNIELDHWHPGWSVRLGCDQC